MVFKIDCPEKKFQTIFSQSQFEKGNCPEVHCGTPDNYFQ